MDFLDVEMFRLKIDTKARSDIGDSATPIGKFFLTKKSKEILLYIFVT